MIRIFKTLAYNYPVGTDGDIHLIGDISFSRECYCEHNIIQLYGFGEYTFIFLIECSLFSHLSGLIKPI